MIFEILLTSCLSFNPTDCGTGRIPVEGDLAACRERARVIAAHVPDSAQLQSYACIEVGAPPDFLVSEIAPGVFVHKGSADAGPDTNNRGDLANVGFIIGESSVAVIDSGSHPWIGAALLQAIRAETTLPISEIILTGPSPHRVLGTRPLLEDGGSVIGHADLAEVVSERSADYLAELKRLGLHELSNADIVVPDSGVDLVRIISLGNRELILSAHPVGRSGTDLTVLDMATGTLFLGDLFSAVRTPVVVGAVGPWRELLEDLTQLPAERIVPGRGPVAMVWSDGAHAHAQMRYLDALLGDARHALQQGLSPDQAVSTIAAGERARWLHFDRFHPANVAAVMRELQPE